MSHYKGYTMEERRTIARVLNVIANELDARFGPHPTVPIETTKQIAIEVINRLGMPDRQFWLKTIDKEIDYAFGKVSDV